MSISIDEIEASKKVVPQAMIFIEIGRNHRSHMREKMKALHIIGNAQLFIIHI